MPKMKQGEIEVRILFETPESKNARTAIHIVDRLGNSLAQVQETSIAAEFLEDGRRVRYVEFGEFTAEMQKVVDDEFTTEEEAAQG